MASNDWFDKDFYAVLGVAKDVSAADLKKQYRKLARQFHPDSNPGDAAAEARFKEISEAHAVLADPKQRQEYDAVRAMAGGRPRFAPGGSGGFEDVFGGFGGGPRVQYSQGDFEDLLGGMFGSQGGFGGCPQAPERHCPQHMTDPSPVAAHAWICETPIDIAPVRPSTGFPGSGFSRPL